VNVTRLDCVYGEGRTPRPTEREAHGVREEAVSYGGVDVRGDARPGGRGGRGGRGFGSGRAVLLLVAVALAGGAIDIVTGTGLRLGFAIGLALGSLLAALLVDRPGLLVVVFAPPLVFLAASMLFVLFAPGGAGGPGKLIDAATGWLVYGFPTMATATGIAAVVAGLRIARGPELR
jgi:hypothetical protein